MPLYSGDSLTNASIRPYITNPSHLTNKAHDQHPSIRSPNSKNPEIVTPQRHPQLNNFPLHQATFSPPLTMHVKLKRGYDDELVHEILFINKSFVSGGRREGGVLVQDIDLNYSNTLHTNYNQQPIKRHINLQNIYITPSISSSTCISIINNYPKYLHHGSSTNSHINCNPHFSPIRSSNFPIRSSWCRPLHAPHK
jgi:hypothetical protein